MNAVGIDVSKDKSMITVMQPLGVVVAEPYEVRHTESELRELAEFLKSLSGETKVIMEYTGHYYEPIVRYLHDSGLFVFVVNDILIHDFSENTKVRKSKTDEKDAVKIALWGFLTGWICQSIHLKYRLARTLEDCHKKCVDFALYLWHRECVSGIFENAFMKKYETWCCKHGYHYCDSKASEIHAKARASILTC